MAGLIIISVLCIVLSIIALVYATVYMEESRELLSNTEELNKKYNYIVCKLDVFNGCDSKFKRLDKNVSMLNRDISDLYNKLADLRFSINKQITVEPEQEAESFVKSSEELFNEVLEIVDDE